MDRNILDGSSIRRLAGVALLAEGVDRNVHGLLLTGLGLAVALLAEGVDRNRASTTIWPLRSASPSSRRAWIEI